MRSCFPDYIALDVIEAFEPGAPRGFSHFLRSENTDGVFLTKAKLAGDFDGDKTIDFAINFETDEVGLPYNLFAMLVTKEIEVTVWLDFTQGCTGLPLSIFPGHSSALTKAKLPRREAVSLHMLVWGR
jgi:hypothetical protein